MSRPDPGRYRLTSRLLGSRRLASASREYLAERPGVSALRADLVAGLVVGIVALPLSMALAISSGMPPQHGLYTALVAGAVAPVLGGSRFNITGPTAAFVVLLAPVTLRHGPAGLMLASLMAGCILTFLGLLRFGKLIQFVPYPVTTGFTAGIAVVIAILQVPGFLGISPQTTGEHLLDKLVATARALPTTSPGDLLVGLATVAVLLLFPRLTRKLPSPLVAVVAGALLGYALTRLVPGWSVETIGSRFHYVLPDGSAGAGIPALLPVPDWPWNAAGPDGKPLGLSYDLLRELMGPAVAIALLGAIESLLCAVVADGMTGSKHDPDGELLGQGIANIVAPFFGGFAATGAVARTATSIRAGAKGPLAGVVHAAFILAALVALAPLLAHLPIASLSALLLVVAWNMADARHFGHVLRMAPRSDVLVLLACFGLTVLFDMVVSVGVGVVLAAFLFMRRMAEVSSTRVLDEEDDGTPLRSDGVLCYEIKGPLFFGAAEKAVNALGRVAPELRAVAISIQHVPAMDVTGLVALESAVGRLLDRGISVCLVGVDGQPREVLKRSKLMHDPRILFAPTMREARELLAGNNAP